MARRRQKLPFATAWPVPTVTFAADDWGAIEAAYGSAIPDTARKGIEDATRDYVRVERFERAAEPMGDALAILDACEKGAGAFLLALRRLRESDAGGYVATLLEQYGGIDAAGLIEALEGFPFACAMARADIGEAEADRGFVEGEAWQQWIVHLAEILRAHGLPAGARKDGMGTSPFVALVRELEMRIPARRGSAQSDDALAQAVARALRARPN